MPGHEGRPSSPAPEQNPLPDVEVAEQPPEPITPEEAAKEQQDRENRQIDARILDKSFRVRRMLNKSVTEVISTKNEITAKTKNAFSTPKNIYLTARHRSAQEKYNRKKDKADNARFFKRYRQNAAKDALLKMNARKGKLDRHTNMMQGRLDKARGVREYHETIDRNRIKSYIDRKHLAQSRKEMRVMRREMRNDGKSRIEVTRTLSNLSIEQRKRIGEISLRIARAEEPRDDIANDKARTQAQRTSASERIRSNTENLEGMRASRAATIANVIKNVGNRETLLQKIQSIRNKLETGLDHDDAMSAEEIAQRQAEDPLYQPGADALPTEINDSGRELLQTQLMAAETELAGLNKAIESSEKTITELNTSIGRAEKTISTNKEKVTEYNEKISEYDEKITEHNAAIEQLRAERDRIVKEETAVAAGGGGEQSPTTSPAQAEVIDLATARTQRSASQTSSPGYRVDIPEGDNVIDLQSARARRDPSQQTPPPESVREAA